MGIVQYSTMRVLIVDTSREERQRVVGALCDLTNIVVVGAVARLHGALYALVDTIPDVIVTDSDLADDHAADLIAAVQRTARPPVVVVYGAPTEAERERCLDAGAEHYVPKSAGLEALQHAISCVNLARRRRPSANDRYAQIGRLAASATHDLRNYLGAAELSLARVERAPIPANDPARASLVTLHKALDSAHRITSTLLAYANERVPDMEPVSIPAVVRHTLELFHRTLPPGISTVLALDPVPPIRGVQSELEQLVMNLIFNAADAMPDGGNVSISVHLEGTAVVLEVRDSSREAGAPQPARAGLGIGLSRDVAQRHDAKLKIISIPNSGTQVVVEFAAHAA